MRQQYRPLKKVALFLAFQILLQAISPSLLMALSGGPNQPEMTAFSPAGVSDMVDLFTGDFSYNIPLLDVDGYPINISYNSNPSMDQEASWVGLGWNLNPGTISRNLRGLPDDFNNEQIVNEFNMKPNTTIGVGGAITAELFGMGNLSANAGIFYNNYKGFGREFGISPSISIASKNSTKVGKLGLNFNNNSQSGINIGASIGLADEAKKSGYNLSFSGFNSRRGLSDLSVRLSSNKDKVNSIPLSNNFTFGDFTYFPSPSMPITSSSFSFSASLGAELFGITGGFSPRGYFTKQELLKKVDSRSAFGYLHSKKGTDHEGSLLDFNVEKDGAFRENTPIIPLSHGTYDIFSATGQGLSGQFRAMRNDVGLFSKDFTAPFSDNGNIGVEVDAANLFHGGFEADATSTQSSGTPWESNNLIKNNLAFTENKEIYEAVYFKGSTEKIITDPVFYEAIGGDDPIKVKLSNVDAKARANSKFTVEEQQTYKSVKTINGSLHRNENKREKRNQIFNYLNAKEANQVGLNTKILSYPENQIVVSSCDDAMITPIDRVSINGSDNFRKDDHMSEITITQNDGARYVYGIPAYNLCQREVSFNVEEGTVDNQLEVNNELISYRTDKDNSTSNEKGLDHHFDAKEIPPYAHSFLLTAVLTPDYVDLTGDGVTDDDPGNAIRFNYSKIHGDENRTDTNNEGFHWRVPAKQGKARFMEGFKSKANDDKASYIYGEKEIWFLHSIESKTMLAQFYLNNNRQDALGVIDENGGVDASKTNRSLNRIELYSKSELLENSADPTPIKTVHFEYAANDPLCKSISNSAAGEGKLTLEKIYFTYGKSQRGRLNAYHFDYAVNNPNYGIGDFDRWGTFKSLNGINSTFSNNNYPHAVNFPNNTEFPYTIQSPEITNTFVDAWNLSRITLPSGSVIDVEYESDDYAYVQNKRAGQMMFIHGFADTPNGIVHDELYEYKLIPPQYNPRKYLLVELTQPIGTNLPPDDAKKEMLKRYFEDVNELYFNCFIDLNNKGTNEFVKGYVNIIKAGIEFTDNNYTTIAIPIKMMSTRGNPIHPITRAAITSLKVGFPELVYPGYEVNGVLSAVQAMVSFAPEIKKLIKGFEPVGMSKNWGNKIDTNKSWVRLANPDFKKLGGGSRVKKISISDEWNNVAGDHPSSFGQEYSYATTMDLGGKQIEISSGVASYEPLVGNDENLMRVPLPYEEEVKLAPNNYYYIEKPIGESLFPSPTVGYSEVKVTSFGEYNGVSKSDIGYSFNKFYTAKDFPVRTDYTNPQPIRSNPNDLLKFFKINIEEEYGVSQGFVVELNDMHGKPLETASYDNLNNLITSSKYFYHVENEEAQEKQLNNTVDVIDKEGKVSKAEIGLEVDIWQDMRHEESYTEVGGVMVNTDGFLAFVVPLIIPVPIPKIQRQRLTYKSASTTKLIKRSGLIKKVVVTENGASIATVNKLFDAETGSVLMTETENEFNDNLFSLNYPAHWAYDGMGQAYQNTGAIFENVSIVNGQPFGVGNHLSPGDELYIELLPTNGTDYVALQERYYAVETAPGTLIIMDKNGVPLIDVLGQTFKIKILRSGRRNLASMPIASVTSRENPVASGQLQMNNNLKILQSSGAVYDDNWHKQCSLTPSCETVSNSTFSSGAQAGALPSPGAMADWTKVSSPLNLPATVITDDGFDDEECIEMEGFAFAPTGIQQENIVIEAGKTYQINFCNKFLNQDFTDHINYKFLVAKDPFLNDACATDCQLVDNVKIQTTDQEWHCLSTQTFVADSYYDVLGVFVTTDSLSAVDQFPIGRLDNICIEEIVPNAPPPGTVNPYVTGLKGNWRPSSSHVYLTNRTPQVQSPSPVDIRNEGFYADFTPFWAIQNGDWTYSNDPKWIESNRITYYDARSNELENQDALGNFSSAQFGFNKNRVTAIASNAQKSEMYYDSFEDYAYESNCKSINEPCRFSVRDAFEIQLEEGRAHTGHYSIRLFPGVTLRKEIPLQPICAALPSGPGQANYDVVGDYIVENCNSLLPDFHPEVGKAYYFNFWVGNNSSINRGKPIDIANVVVSFDDGTTFTDIAMNSAVVEGWQRVSGDFNIPTSATTMTITVTNNHNNESLLIDDFRLHPVNSNMVSYVYDYKSMRLMAQLDDNNYATLYEYVDEGILIRTKKETEKGIVTLQESRTVLSPNN